MELEAAKEQLRQQIEAMERLFTSPDMKVLLDQIKEWQEDLAARWRSLKPEQLGFEQGRYDAFEQIAKWGETCEKIKESDLLDAATADEDPYHV